LGYDLNGNLTNLNRAVKENLKTYMNEYRMLTDGVNISDGYIINVGVEFDIIIYNNYKRQYDLDRDSLKFTYELPQKESEDEIFNVIVLPTGDSDIGAQRKDVKVSFLLFH
jgi:hypothetical protein